jgi:hypothetical protein
MLNIKLLPLRIVQIQQCLLNIEKPLKFDKCKYFLFWKCWQSYALEISIEGYTILQVNFFYCDSTPALCRDILIDFGLLYPRSAEPPREVSSGGGVSGRRRVFAATAGARCRSRLIAHCQICPAPRTSTIQGKRSLIFLFSHHFG